MTSVWYGRNLLPYSDEYTLSVIGGEENTELSVNQGHFEETGPNKEEENAENCMGFFMICDNN
jgi:hypothetical protein